jgi:hypothetical protein
VTNMAIGRRRRGGESDADLAQTLQVGQLIGQLDLYARRLQAVVERAENVIEEQHPKGATNDGPQQQQQ